MDISTVNISFKKDFLEMVDQVAREESRSRSELIREAARIYIERKQRWNKIFAFGDMKRSESPITEADLEDEIHRFRKLKKG